MLRVNAINRQELLKHLTFHHKCLVFKTVSVPAVNDRRNIHFYINSLGFHAVEFFNEYHPDPHMPEQFDQEDGLFRFEKRMAD